MGSLKYHYMICIFIFLHCDSCKLSRICLLAFSYMFLIHWNVYHVTSEVHYKSVRCCIKLTFTKQHSYSCYLYDMTKWIIFLYTFGCWLELWETGISVTIPLAGNCTSCLYSTDVCLIESPARFVAFIVK